MRKRSAFEPTADGENNDEDEGDDDGQHDKLYLHVLQPHLLSQLRSLLPKVLGLGSNSKGIGQGAPIGQSQWRGLPGSGGSRSCRPGARSSRLDRGPDMGRREEWVKRNERGNCRTKRCLES